MWDITGNEDQSIPTTGLEQHTSTSITVRQHKQWVPLPPVTVSETIEQSINQSIPTTGLEQHTSTSITVRQHKQWVPLPPVTVSETIEQSVNQSIPTTGLEQHISTSITVRQHKQWVPYCQSYTGASILNMSNRYINCKQYLYHHVSQTV